MNLVKATLVVFIAINVIVGFFVDYSPSNSKTTPETVETLSAEEFVERKEMELVIGSNLPVIDTGEELFSSIENASKEAKIDDTSETTETKAKVEAEIEAETEVKVKSKVEAEAEAEAEAKSKDKTTPKTEKKLKKTENKSDKKSEKKSEKKSAKKSTKNLISETYNNSSVYKKIHAIMQYLVKEGFTPEAAAGVAGNIAMESEYDTSLVSRSGYHGLCQWNTNSEGDYWWYSIENWLDSNGYAWNSFEGQVRAIVECSKKGNMTLSRFKELKSLKNVEQATELFCVYYEACPGGSSRTSYYNVGTCYQGLSTRKKEAWIAYEMYKNPKLKYSGKAR